MWWAILKCVKVVFLGVFFGLVFTTSVQAWSTATVPEHELSEIKDSATGMCSGHYGIITVAGERDINACIMGGDTRVASYYAAEGGVSYAVSFPSDTKFYRLDICSGTGGCIYSEEGDSLIGPNGGYGQLVANLDKTIQNGVIHYTPNEHAKAFNMSDLTGVSIFGYTAALSANGKWGIIEARGYGIFRINTQTLEVRRVYAPGFSYGYGYDPRAELAISNDGQTFGIVGLNLSVWLIRINDTCGDIPNQYMQAHYVGAVTACRYLETPTSAYMTNFYYATRPKFSSDNKSFSFDAYSRSEPPYHVTLFSEKRSENAPSYVAIGDSFTSGEGETDDAFYIGGAANRCHVSSRSYPYLLSHSWGVRGFSTACSGATIDSSRADNSESIQPAQLSILESYNPQIATIGIGGNDVGLVGKLKDCLGLDTCSWAKTPADRKNTALEIKNLYPRLLGFYQDVKARTSKTVIAVGYPFIISPDTECESPIGILLDETERVFMNESIQYLNRVIQAAASDAGIEYASIEGTFYGERMCDSLVSPMMNEVRFGDDFPNISALPFVKLIGAESFHPRPEAHLKIHNSIFHAFPNPAALDECTSCSTLQGVPVASEYWQSDETYLPSWRALPFINKITVKKGESFEITFPALSFEPAAEIILELHSEVQNLGVFRAENDGSFSISIPTNILAGGYHSVHAIGKSYSGEAVDRYDFIAIEDDKPTIPALGNSADSLRNDNGPIPSRATNAVVGAEKPMEVLGVSTVTVPNSESIITTKPVTPTLIGSSKKTIFALESALAGLGVGLGLAGIGGVIYAYHYRKRSRYPDG